MDFEAVPLTALCGKATRTREFIRKVDKLTTTWPVNMTTQGIVVAGATDSCASGNRVRGRVGIGTVTGTTVFDVVFSLDSWKMVDI